MDIQEIDRLCDEFERKVRPDSLLRVEEYLSNVDGSDCDELIVELLRIESELAGDNVTPRYPNFSEPLLRKFKAELRRGTEPNIQDYVERASSLCDQLPAKVALLRIKRNFDLSSQRQIARTAIENRLDTPHGADRASVTKEGMPDIIGHYKILQPIGEGGMGTVYMADQLEPVRRRVALKIIKPGMDSQQVVARFEAERQALAMMDHPNIAKVLDAGTTEHGHPFFVMELVKGIPITTYCDENRLTIAERSALFVPLCQAIQHAHQKGIIHRDIKPSNVLVCSNDGQAVPKVIDFGVAKAVAQQLTDKTMYTQFGQVIGTLEYMSPEQAGLSQFDIDTRSDVYSLGVLLYELFTGSTPLTKQHLRQAGFEESMRLIREVEPPKPSSRLNSSGDDLSSISAQRRTEPRKLGGLLRGELDWIVMKSLEKDRTRRYETAISLAHDVRRHLSDDIVEARPPSTWYRLTKIARKNRVVFLTGASFIAMLLYAILTTSSQLRQAEQHQQDTERFGKLLDLVDGMMGEVSEGSLSHTPHAEPIRKTVLENANDLHRVLLELSPSDDSLRVKFARSQQRLGNVYELTGDHDKSIITYEKAIETLETLRTEYPDDLNIQFNLGICHNDLAEVFRVTSSETQAEHHYRAAIDIQAKLNRIRPSSGDFQREFYRTRNNLGFLLTDISRFEESEEILRSGIRDLEKLETKLLPQSELLPICRADLGRMNINLGRCYRLKRDEKSDPEPVYQRAITILQPLVDRYPGDREHRHKIGVAMNNLGNLLGKRGDVDTSSEKAIEWYTKANQWYIKANDELRELRNRFPGIPIYRYELANSYNGLSYAYVKLDQVRQAHESLLAAQGELDQLALDFPTYHERVADNHSLRGMVLGFRGWLAFDKDSNAEAADVLVLKAIENQTRAWKMSPNNPDYWNRLRGHYSFRANVLRQLNRDSEATEVERKAARIRLDNIRESAPTDESTP